MAALFDPTDDYVRSVLNRADFDGEISHPDVEAIVEGGLTGNALPNGDHRAGPDL
jgi:hypothetical protein